MAPDASKTNTCAPVSAVFVVVTDDLDAAVAVEVGRGHAARLGALPAAARRGRPAGLDPQPPAGEVVRRDRALVAADHDLVHAVAVEVGDHAGRVDAALGRRALAEQPAAAS